jgi:predicted metalloprotease with PDZ domain
MGWNCVLAAILVWSLMVERGMGEGTIGYRVRFPDAGNHLIEVEARIPTGGGATIEVMMPVWTPGSYLVREYSRHVEGMSAWGEGGQALVVTKTRKNRWRVGCEGERAVRLRYRVYCREMGVQTNWVDRSFALLNGAATFVTRPEALGWAHEVEIEPPAGWARVISGMRGGERAGCFRAEDYDELVDSPIYAGDARVYRFEVDGKEHLLVNEGEHGVWDGDRAVADVERIVRAQRAFWGMLPYERYVFFNIMSETGGGLEHRNSTVLMTSRFATRTRGSYLDWLTLVSHEFFHTWNGKRLRPEELGPFDYEQETHTRGLWIVEGLTSYYDRLLVRRAGLCSVAEYLAGDAASGGETAKSDIERLQGTHGRLVQTLENASFDAWIKHYRRDENTANTAISYYLKGAVVGWLLDAEIRRATGGKKSLDDAMRLAYERYSGSRGYTTMEFRGVCAEVAGKDLSEFFRHALETTEELDYEPALRWFGLRFKTAEPAKPGAVVKAWLGIETRREEGRLVVSQVRRDSPGWRAGLNVGDELVGFGEERIRPETYGKRLEQYRPGERVEVLVSRRDRLMRLPLVLGEEPGSVHVLEEDPQAGEGIVAERKSWLGE